jgi:hypothetical protein
MTASARQTTRRELLEAGFGSLLVLSARLRSGHAGDAAHPALKISDHLSPRNKRRPARPHTYYLVLHTTEGAEAGSLDKVWRLGEANYFVKSNGTVLRIIERTRIATHAGRSMWEGHRNIDDYSIGIEVVGRHDREISEAQYDALRELLRQLKSLYRIPDSRVLTHSMVAYGRPNRFYRFDHRGRKRCGMIFARPDVRLKLGLQSKPDRDVDVRFGRLKIGDAELYRFLFASPPAAAASAPPPSPAAQVPAESDTITKDWTAWHIAREKYDHADTTYIFPDGRRLQGDQIQDWGRIPAGTRVVVADTDDEQAMEDFLEVKEDGQSARSVAGEGFNRSTTIYFLPDGLIRTGRELGGSASSPLLERLPKGTRVLAGYVYGGHVRSSRPPSSIAGAKWNYPSTYYRFPDGRIVSGDEVDASAIPAQTLVFYRN